MRGRAILFGLMACLFGQAEAQSSKDRDVEIVSPPVPEFPLEASVRGIEGNCYVRFSVDESGLPFGMESSCSHPVFCSEARRAVSRATFRPKIENGYPAVRGNIVYPLTFTLTRWSWLTFRYVSDGDYVEQPVEPCEEIAVS